MTVCIVFYGNSYFGPKFIQFREKEAGYGMWCTAENQFQVQSYKFSHNDAVLIHVSQYVPANMQMPQM